MTHHRSPGLVTRALARILGPFHIVIGAVAIWHAKVPTNNPETRYPLSDYGVWPWATGAALLFVGLAVLALQRRLDTLAAAAVWAIGLLMTARGLVLMTWPALLTTVLNIPSLWYAVYVLLVVVGCYLTWVGWRPAKPD
jgi:hypothetical protein